MTQYLVGADPELFLIDSEGNFRSAHNVIQGNKVNAMPVEKGAVQVDGVAAEFNIFPASTAIEFSANIRTVLTQLNKMVKEKNPKLSLMVKPTATFDKQYFRKLPKAVKALGCTADWDAYTGKIFDKPDNRQPMRTGGGHVHIGWTENANPSDDSHIFDASEATKQLDAVLYHSSLLWDDDQERRKMYGKIGCFRSTTYGVEYRPLSNAWVADPDLQLWVFNATVRAMELFDNDEIIFLQPWARSLKDKAIKEELPKKEELRNYSKWLTERYGIPPLPEAYTRYVA